MLCIYVKAMCNGEDDNAKDPLVPASDLWVQELWYNQSVCAFLNCSLLITCKHQKESKSYIIMIVTFPVINVV